MANLDELVEKVKIECGDAYYFSDDVVGETIKPFAFSPSMSAEFFSLLHPDYYLSRFNPFLPFEFRAIIKDKQDARFKLKKDCLYLFHYSLPVKKFMEIVQESLDLYKTEMDLLFCKEKEGRFSTHVEHMKSLSLNSFLRFYGKFVVDASCLLPFYSLSEHTMVDLPTLFGKKEIMKGVVSFCKENGWNYFDLLARINVPSLDYLRERITSVKIIDLLDKPKKLELSLNP